MFGLQVMEDDIHIGSIIAQKVKEQGLKIAEFAAAIHCTRPNVHSIFRRKSIDVEQLRLISKALRYDFFELYRSKENEPMPRCISIIELDKLKLKELSDDNSITIIQSWSMSK